MAEIIPAAPSPLRRLPGTSPSLARRYGAQARLWLDGTQLLQESVRSYTQEIQRFDLADIQAVQLRRTPRGLIYNVILAAPLALFLIILATTWNDPTTSFGDRVFSASAAGFFALFLVINTLRGATCRTTLTTALGSQVLPSLSRVGATRKALLRISAAVAAVQGALRPDEAALEVDRARTRTPLAPAPAAVAQSRGYTS